MLLSVCTSAKPPLFFHSFLPRFAPFARNPEMLELLHSTEYPFILPFFPQECTNGVAVRGEANAAKLLIVRRMSLKVKRVKTGTKYICVKSVCLPICVFMAAGFFFYSSHLTKLTSTSGMLYTEQHKLARLWDGV